MLSKCLSWQDDFQGYPKYVVSHGKNLGMMINYFKHSTKKLTADEDEEECKPIHDDKR